MSDYPFNRLTIEDVSEQHDGLVINAKETFKRTYKVTNKTEPGISFSNIRMKITETKYARPDSTDMPVSVPVTGLAFDNQVYVTVNFTALTNTPEIYRPIGDKGGGVRFSTPVKIASVSLDADVQIQIQKHGSTDGHPLITAIQSGTSFID